MKSTITSLFLLAIIPIVSLSQPLFKVNNPYQGETERYRICYDEGPLSVSMVTPNIYNTYKWTVDGRVIGTSYNPPNGFSDVDGAFDLRLEVTKTTPFRVIDKITVLGANSTGFSGCEGVNESTPEYYLEFKKGSDLLFVGDEVEKNYPVPFNIPGISLSQGFDILLYEADYHFCPLFTFNYGDDFLGSVFVPANYQGGILTGSNGVRIEITTKMVNSIYYQVDMVSYNDKPNISCIGDSLITYASGNAYVSFTWINQGNNQSTIDADGGAFYPPVGGTYTVDRSHLGCHRRSDAITFEIKNTLAINADASGLSSNCSVSTIKLKSNISDTLNYMFYWTLNNDTVGTKNTYFAKQNGNYKLKIKHLTQCTRFNSPGINITAINTGNALTVDIAKNESLCQKLSAIANFSVQSYRWSGLITLRPLLHKFPPLYSGTYSLTVTSGNCKLTSEIEVTPQYALQINATNPSCPTVSNGSITAISSSLNSPSTFNWSNGRTGATITSLSSGSYTVTVTDRIGCRTFNSVTIQTSRYPKMSVKEDLKACQNMSNGAISFNTSECAAPMYFNVLNTTIQSNNPTISGLAAGNYVVKVTDKDGCTATSAIAVSVSNITKTAENIKKPTGQTTCDGSIEITINPNGFNGLLSYSWNVSQTTATINNLCPNVYSVTVTDANRCSKIFGPWNLNLSSTATSEQISLNNSIEVYPNPTSGQSTIRNLDGDNIIKGMKIIDISGREYSIDQKYAADKVDISEVPSGFYLLVINTENGIITKKIEKF
ncbi:MAG: T9SS type A sorting domain-containing protein [Saprospiraceae bacterium]|nr:T9SS type A sorting domain-containing protein [Saprospiraceae bacterium]